MYYFNQSTVVSTLSVFVNIQPLLLDSGGNSDSATLFQEFHGSETEQEGPEGYAQHTESLHPKQGPSASVEETVRAVEKSNAESAQNTADPVYGNRTHRIVDFKSVVKQVHGKSHCNTADKTDNGSSSQGYHVTRSGNTHKTG